MATTVVSGGRAGPNDVLTHEVEGAERLHWTGRPQPWALARTALPRALASLAFAAFGAYGLSAAITSGSQFGIIFMVIWMTIVTLGVIQPFWLGARARWIAYGISDHRLLEVCTFPTRRTRSIPLRGVPWIDLRERGDGSGDLVFGEERFSAGEGVTARKFGFFGIPHVRQVQRTILDLATRNG